MSPSQTLYSEQLSGTPFNSTDSMINSTSTLTVAPPTCIPIDEWDDDDDNEESEDEGQIKTEVDPDLEDDDNAVSDDDKDESEEEEDDVFEQYLFGEDDEQ